MLAGRGPAQRSCEQHVQVGAEFFALDAADWCDAEEALEGVLNREHEEAPSVFDLGVVDGIHLAPEGSGKKELGAEDFEEQEAREVRDGEVVEDQTNDLATAAFDLGGADGTDPAPIAVEDVEGYEDLLAALVDALSYQVNQVKVNGEGHGGGGRRRPLFGAAGRRSGNGDGAPRRGPVAVQGPQAARRRRRDVRGVGG